MTKKCFLIWVSVFLLCSCTGTIHDQFIRTPQPTPAPQPAPIQVKKDQTNISSPVPVNNPLPKSQIIIPKKIKVAALLPLSGKNKELGTSVLNAITLSLFENDINGNIELVIFDSQDESPIKEDIQEIADRNIKIVIGPIFSSDVEAISETVKDNNITVLSLSNNQDLSNKNGVFLMGFLPEQQIERMTSYLSSIGRDSISIIAPNNQYGLKFVEILKDFTKKKDGNFITTGLYRNSSKELEMVVAKVVNFYLVTPKAKGVNTKNLTEEDKIYANAIFIPESGQTLSKIVDLIKKFNTTEREIQIIGSSNWDDISTLNDPNLIGGWFVAANPDQYRDFEKKYYRIYDKFPARISSIGYDAIISTIKVIRNSGNQQISPKDFINYQSNKNGFEGIDGLFRFLPNGIVQRNFAILQVENGKFEMIDSPQIMFFKY